MSQQPARFELTKPELVVLTKVVYNPGINAAELTQLTKLNVPAIYRALTHLTRAYLIQSVQRSQHESKLWYPGAGGIELVEANVAFRAELIRIYLKIKEGFYE